MLYIDIHIFLACQRECPFTKCSPEAACASDTDWDLNSFAHLILLETHWFVFFLFRGQCTLIIIFLISPVIRCLNLEWFDWLIDWLGWFIWVHLCSFVFFNLQIYSCNEFARLLSECECFVLLSSQRFFSCFKVDWMLHNAPNIFSSPNSIDISFVCFFLLLFLPTACICTFTKHHFAKCIFCFFTFVCMLLKCH